MSQPLAHESTEQAPPHSRMSCGSKLSHWPCTTELPRAGLEQDSVRDGHISPWAVNSPMFCLEKRPSLLFMPVSQGAGGSFSVGCRPEPAVPSGCAHCQSLQHPDSIWSRSLCQPRCER